MAGHDQTRVTHHITEVLQKYHESGGADRDALAEQLTAFFSRVLRLAARRKLTTAARRAGFVSEEFVGKAVLAFVNRPDPCVTDRDALSAMLLTIAKRRACSANRRAAAEKRGGGREIYSVDQPLDTDMEDEIRKGRAVKEPVPLARDYRVDTGSVPPLPDSDAELELHTGDMQALLDDVLKHVTDERDRMILLARCRGDSCPAIARMLGVSRRMVDDRLKVLEQLPIFRELRERDE